MPTVPAAPVDQRQRPPHAMVVATLGGPIPRKGASTDGRVRRGLGLDGKEAGTPWDFYPFVSDGMEVQS